MMRRIVPIDMLLFLLVERRVSEPPSPWTTVTQHGTAPSQRTKSVIDSRHAATLNRRGIAAYRPA